MSFGLSPREKLQAWIARRYKLDKAPNPVAILCSWGYALAVNLRNLLYDFELLPVKRISGTVVSVGNIASGGTGKSPIVIELALEAQKQGFKPAVLTRGYNSTIKGAQVALYMNGLLIAKRLATPILRHPDEARMQSVKLGTIPVVVCSDRHFGALWLMVQKDIPKPDYWIIDDGFQHRQLHRDCDLVLMDAARPFGNGYQLPAGLLRETKKAINRRASAVVWTRWNPTIQCMSPVNCMQFFVSFATSIGRFEDGAPFTAEFSPALVVLGVARNSEVIAEIEHQGIAIHSLVAGKDHGYFKRSQIEERLSGCNSVITTEKDFWRDPNIFAQLQRPLFIARLQLSFHKSSRGKFFDSIQAFRAKSPPKQPSADETVSVAN